MKALVIVDVQNDFLPGGALAVPDGDEVIPVINNLMEKFDLVVATQDWHPGDHLSFASNHGEGIEPFDKTKVGEFDQVVWPDHCIQGTEGAELSSKLNLKPVKAIFRKGMQPKFDTYSGFFDLGHKYATGLEGYLKSLDVDTIYICGLAGDVCVYYTVLDGCKLGFETFLIEDATRPVEMNEGDFAEAKRKMNKKGAKIVGSDEI